MNRYQVTINAVSTIEVSADSAEDAEQSARDVFSIHTADSSDAEVIMVTQSE